MLGYGVYNIFYEVCIQCFLQVGTLSSLQVNASYNSIKELSLNRTVENGGRSENGNANLSSILQKQSTKVSTVPMRTRNIRLP